MLCTIMGARVDALDAYMYNVQQADDWRPAPHWLRNSCVVQSKVVSGAIDVGRWGVIAGTRHAILESWAEQIRRQAAIYFCLRNTRTSDEK